MKELLRRQLNRFPRLKALLKRVFRVISPAAGVSTDYVEMEISEAGGESARLRDAWQADDLPQRQRKLVDAQLAAFRRGTPVAVFDVIVQALRQLVPKDKRMSLLEVGCSSGYYAEVLEIAGLNVNYAGCDYSEAFIAMARQKYPALGFEVEDATALRYEENTFDVVISGCCLLHIPEYELAVAETARVAREYAIFHRTPVVVGQANKYYRKRAYGVETVEIHFNEPQFLALLAANGLQVIETHTLAETIDAGVGSASRTYVCRKIAV
jgi:SAM-dependent methyltransferase